MTNRAQLELIRAIKVSDSGTAGSDEGLRPIKVPVVALACSSKIKRKGKANFLSPGIF